MINKSSKFKITKTSQASLLSISRSIIYRKPKTREESLYNQKLVWMAKAVGLIMFYRKIMEIAKI